MGKGGGEEGGACGGDVPVPGTMVRYMSMYMYLFTGASFSSKDAPVGAIRSAVAWVAARDQRAGGRPRESRPPCRMQLRASRLAHIIHGHEHGSVEADCCSCCDPLVLALAACDQSKHRALRYRLGTMFLRHAQQIPNVYGGTATGHPQELAAECECGVCKCGYVQLAAGSAGAVVGGILGGRDRVASDVLEHARAHSPYGSCIRVYALGARLERAGSADERRDSAAASLQWPYRVVYWS